MYLSSADWMPRKSGPASGTMFPIQQEDLFKSRAIKILRAQMADNVKARILKQDGSYERMTAGRSEPLRVQEYLFQKNVEEHEHLRSITPVRFTPIKGNE